MRPLVWMGQSDLVRFLNLFWSNCVEVFENLEGSRPQQFKSSNAIKRVFFTHDGTHQVHNNGTEMVSSLLLLCQGM